MYQPIFNKVKFVKSVASTDELPKEQIPEIVFVGRSNVGKSSLLNSLCGRKNIAKISSTPGKTDLPGYGYSRLPKNISDSWGKLIEQYLLTSKNLLLILLLIDSRHEPIKSDIEMIDWLIHNQLPFAIILTKVDKISNTKEQQQIISYRRMLPDNHVLTFSVKNDLRKTKLSKFIYDIIRHL
ncbi:MAG: ribosome biogenesis GTP-binding protein YihA/YsxC [Calditrichaceae bacterium]